jgi:4'-phosphopantetheinyl transferase
MVRVLYAWLSDMEDPAFYNSLNLLPYFMREEILKYRNREEQKARLLARLMLKACLEKDGVSNLIHHWKRDKRNKPLIEKWKPFNISHSSELVVFSYGPSINGVDVEKMTDTHYDEMACYFHPEEQEAIKKSADKMKTFYGLWAKKEALLKATGIGIVDGLDCFSCLKDEVQWVGEKWFFYQLSIHADYAAYLCSKTAKQTCVPERFTIF